DQSISVPMAARISHVRLDAGADVGTAIQWNNAGLMNHFVADDHVTRRLNNLVSKIIQRGQHAGEETSRDAAAVDIKVLPRIHLIRKMLAGTEPAAHALDVLSSLLGHCGDSSIG